MKITTLSAVLIASSLLVACGGGGGGSNTSSTAIAPTASTDYKGFWKGKTSDNRTTYSVLLSDGSYYAFYSEPNDAATAGGVMHGTVTAAGSSLSSSTVKDFNYQTESMTTNNLSASYVAKTSLNGSLTPATGSAVTFTSAYDTEFDSTPSVANLVGNYKGDWGLLHEGPNNVNTTIDGTGKISITSYGCNINGSLTPRNDGNVYNVSFMFEAGCSLANKTLTGIAFYNKADSRLLAIAPNADRSDIFVLDIFPLGPMPDSAPAGANTLSLNK